MGVLTTVAYVIYVGAAVLMVFAILLQEGKGGGLSALGGTPAESAFGATNPIRRMTVVLAVLFFLIAGFLSYMGSRKRVTFGDLPGEEPPTPESSEEGGREPAGDVEHNKARDEEATDEDPVTEESQEEEPAGAAPKADASEKDGDVADEAEADAARRAPYSAAGPEKRPEAKE